jgi:hypothetical protein
VGRSFHSRKNRYDPIMETCQSRKFISLLALLVAGALPAFSACSTPVDRSDDSRGYRTNAPPLNQPDIGPSAYDNPSSTAQDNSGGSALLSAAVSSALGGKKNAPPSSLAVIAGKCHATLAAATEDELPCPSLLVAVTDASGTELQRLRTDAQGTFRFQVPSQGSYYVQLLSNAYAWRVDPTGPLSPGGAVTIHASLKN